VPTRYADVTRPKDALTIPVAKLHPDPDQPRREFDEEELARLAESLRTKGQMQPIRVRWTEAEKAWVIVSGERRWRAAKLAGLAALTCVEVKGELTADEILEDQLVENALRTDLKPGEQATAYKTLMDRRGLSAHQLAERLSLSAMTVVRALALLELPASVQQAVEQGTLAPSTAYEVGKLEDPALQAEVAMAAVAEGLTRSEVTELVQAVKAKRPAPAAKPEPQTIDLGDGTTVTIRWKKANAITALQALRKAVKLAQDREKGEQAA
jgi:ParB family chromosome partitioning protein